MNILVSRHGAGTYVTSLSPELLAQPLEFFLSIHGSGIYALFEVRTFLESGAAALAAERATDEELDALMALVDDVRPQADDPDAVREHDVDLHRGIVAAARNPILTRMLESIGDLSARSRARSSRCRESRAGRSRTTRRSWRRCARATPYARRRPCLTTSTTSQRRCARRRRADETVSHNEGDN